MLYICVSNRQRAAAAREEIGATPSSQGGTGACMSLHKTILALFRSKQQCTDKPHSDCEGLGPYTNGNYLARFIIIPTCFNHFVTDQAAAASTVTRWRSQARLLQQHYNYKYHIILVKIY